jgi:NAD(P)-dependent dehydrogenase (short-subunit alcohol dehydrogenase family)
VSDVAARGRRWTEADVPEQHGRTALITGANSGIGFQVAAALARQGAAVILACRDRAKGREAAGRITALVPQAVTQVVDLDLGSLASVRAAADELKSGPASLDLVINNAGLMAAAPPGTTADGFELHFGTNHLGHFALTGLLLDRLLASRGSRVVTVSSVAHRFGDADFSQVQSSRVYQGGAAYAQSKLANLLFAFELERRLAAARAQAASLAAHPGFAQTNLLRHWPAVIRAAARPVEPLIGQSARMGALPVLRAATDLAARGGEYYGPGGLMRLTGYPELARPARRARDTEAQRRLWEESERLTGVTYPV